MGEILTAFYRAEVEIRDGKFVEDAETSDHIGKAASWLTGQQRPGLLIFGSVGNGKTTLARAITKAVSFCNNCEVPYCSALDLANIAANHPDRFKELRTTPLLAIDDIGAEPADVKVWGNVISPFVDIIYKRYELRLFTVLTSNLNLEEITRKYGERIGDRFMELFDRLVFDNKSYRK